MNGEDVFAIMQKVLLRENKIDWDKEHFWIIGLDADNRILFIELIQNHASKGLRRSWPVLLRYVRHWPYTWRKNRTTLCVQMT